MGTTLVTHRPRPPRSLAALAPLLGLLLAMSLAFPAPAAAQKRATACGPAIDRVPGTQISPARAQRATQCLVNQRRAANGVQRVRHSRLLTRAARQHSRQMVRTGCFDHQCPGGPNLSQRLGRVGYLLGSLLGWRVGENIAWGTGRYGTPRQIVRSWMRSPGHRRNLLDPSYREHGIGVVRAAPQRVDAVGGTYTSNFGTRRR